MANKYLIDTHALLWYLEANRRLGLQAKAIMDNPHTEMVLSVISLAEAAIIIDKGRTAIPNMTELLNLVAADERIEIHAVTLEVLKRSLTPDGLTISELHDRLIVSTGLYLQGLGATVTMLTRDIQITKAKVLPVIW